MTIDELVAGVLAGDKRCIARAITIVENNPVEAPKLIARIYCNTGKAHIIGVTGAGGAGKSTLVEKIVKQYRMLGETVGVVAVDPSSPFTGGAFLGDRIRMQDLTSDKGVFIRSMATRNYVGGIARATKDAVNVLDASGKGIVIVETAGAGQSEVEIIRVAQTIVVVHAPGLGDEIQAIKAGMMEIADVFVVNKADRENADKTAMDIRTIQQLDTMERAWKVPVLKTVALTGEGVPELVEKIEEHRCIYRRETGQKRSALRAENELVQAIRDIAAQKILEKLKKKGKFDEALQRILGKEIDPASAAQELLSEE